MTLSCTSRYLTQSSCSPSPTPTGRLHQCCACHPPALGVLGPRVAEAEVRLACVSTPKHLHACIGGGGGMWYRTRSTARWVRLLHRRSVPSSSTEGSSQTTARTTAGSRQWSSSTSRKAGSEAGSSGCPTRGISRPAGRCLQRQSRASEAAD